MTETSLAVRSALDVDDAQAGKRTAQLLKHRGGLFPQDMTEGMAAIMARLSLAYGLDPFAEELILYQGKPYLTVRGAMRLANDHPQFDGLECAPATPEERTAFRADDDEELWVARVWRRDRRVPIVGYGRASEGDGNPVGRKWAPEMAQKRAKHRALRDAFSLPVAGFEEVGDPVVSPAAGPVIDGAARELAPTPMITKEQITAIHAIAGAIGWIDRDDDEHYRASLHSTFGVFTSKDLTQSQAAAFLEMLVAEQNRQIDDGVAAAKEAAAAKGERVRDTISPPDDRPAPQKALDAYAAALTRANQLGIDLAPYALNTDKITAAKLDALHASLDAAIKANEPPERLGGM